MNSKNKIKSFTDLNVWQEGHKLVLMVYQITKTFPKEEKFGIIDQMRRAAISITSNIAEGFSRQTFKEKTQFYYMALGSITELQNQLLVAKDIDYLKEKDFKEVAGQIIIVHKLLNAFITKTKSLA